MGSYRREKTILFFSYLVGIFLLGKFVPKDKVRHATVAFLIKQVMTWLFGLLVVEKKLIEYPYRFFFRRSYKANFSFEFFLYPITCVIFNLYYPEKRSRFIKTLYSIAFAAFIAIPEALIVRYSRLIRYKKWNALLSFFTMMTTNYLSHIFYRWFFKHNAEIIDISKSS